MAVIDQPTGRLRGPVPRAVPPLTPRAGQASTIPVSRNLTGKLPVPVLLYFAVVMLPVYTNIGPILMTGLRAYLILMVVPLTFRLLAGKYGPVMWTDILFFAHIGWMSVAIAVNNPSMVVQNTGSAAVEFLGGYLVARAYIRSRADFIALCRWLGMLVALTLPLALIESQTGHSVLPALLNKLPGVSSIGDFYIEPRMGLQRSKVFLPHPIHYGLFASTAFALTVVGLKNLIPNGRRRLLGGSIGVCVFLSLSSGALLPMVMQIFLISWFALFHRMNRPWLVLGLLTAAAYIIVDMISNRSALMVFLSYATFSSHNAYWRAQIFEWGMVNVWANPVFGLGFNDWVRPFYMYSGSMDNFWLVMAVRYGIPGFLLIAAGYMIGLLRVGFRNFANDPVLAQLRRGWMFTFIGLTLTMCTVHIWTTIYSFVFFMFGAGMWFIYTEPAGPDASFPDPDNNADPSLASKGTTAREGMRYTRFPNPARP